MFSTSRALLPTALLLAGSVFVSERAAAEAAWTDEPATVVTLLSPGAAPLRARTYSPLPGTQRVQRLQQHELEATSVVGGAGREDTGQVRVVYDLRLVPDDDPQRITIEATLQELDAPGPEDEEEEPGPRDVGLLQLDLQGRPLRSAWTTATSDPLLLRARGRVATLATPLPAEPIGEGARWEVRQTTEAGGASLTLVSTCTLVAEVPAGLDIECTFRHEASGGAFAEKTGPLKRGEVRVLDSEISGRSLILQSLDALGPLREDGDLHTTITAKARQAVFPTRITLQVAERWNVVGGE